MSSVWDSQQYLKFAGERTQPSIDLAARVTLAAPRRVIDLGCGPGNSTAVLAARWPQAEITGLDNSREMLAQAKADHPDMRWIEGDIAGWQAEQPYDLVFTNAALQWVPDHARLMPALLAQVAPGGALAVQMPRNGDNPAHAAMRTVAAEGPWASRIARPRGNIAVEPPGFYYDLLRPLAKRFEVWETEYQHVLADVPAIVEWVRGTGLRPYIDPLGPDERKEFLARYLARLEQAYKPQADGKVILPFRRLFFIASR
ncbi:MAG TPA: trans-aconitate 2-methyltransferase [Candidatus Sulfotelmatobacter sp.]|nr:trans-aconitate 2-methyltransferase [Candidatus Sulfotelmatobacter sp.]